MRCRTEQLPSNTRPAGISLFEVVLALAIFLGAFAAIGQVLRTGTTSSIRAQLTTQAALQCERVMNDVLGGVLPLQSVGQTRIDDDPQWVYSVNVLDGGVPNLLIVEAVVERLGSRQTSSVSYRLTRMIRDPQIYLDAASLGTGALP